MDISREKKPNAAILNRRFFQIALVAKDNLFDLAIRMIDLQAKGTPV